MKLLSVAIPCYNSEAYMEHCIRSLLTGGDEVEILIVDDGSTKDRTAEIAMNIEKRYPGYLPRESIRKTAVMVKLSMRD